MANFIATSAQAQTIPFNFGNHPVRVVVRDGEPWFVATDVCEALEYVNPRDAVATHLDDDERMTVADSDGHSGKRGGARYRTIINESGLFALVLRSRKPAARKFSKWVTGEVLPSIRKTGRYGEPMQPALPNLPAATDMLEIQGTSGNVSIPESINEQIKLRAYSLSLEAYDLIKIHLRQRVEFECASGYPAKTIDEEKAIACINRGGIAHALAYSYYTELNRAKMFAEHARKTADELIAKLGGKAK